VAEAQSKWFARVLSAQIQPPTPAQMQASIEKWVAKVQATNKCYRVMDINPATYVDKLERWGSKDTVAQPKMHLLSPKNLAALLVAPFAKAPVTAGSTTDDQAAPSRRSTKKCNIT
jgi:hypothetical protein